MSVEMSNELGKIIMTEDLVASIAGYAACENYGIVGMSSKKASDAIIELIKKDNLKRGIKVTSVGPGEVDIDLYVMLEYGVSLSAVAQNARDNVRYRVQEMTGLTCKREHLCGGHPCLTDAARTSAYRVCVYGGARWEETDLDGMKISGELLKDMIFTAPRCWSGQGAHRFAQRVPGPRRRHGNQHDDTMQSAIKRSKTPTARLSPALRTR
jgi:uncharacterized alkaline shock family protein YloU